MQYPNLRYGNPQELEYYAGFYPAAERITRLARQLRRSERTIRDWLEQRQKVPWWVPEILRLQHMEYCDRMRQMRIKPERTALQPVILRDVAEQKLFELRRADFG